MEPRSRKLVGVPIKSPMFLSVDMYVFCYPFYGGFAVFLGQRIAEATIEVLSLRTVRSLANFLGTREPRGRAALGLKTPKALPEKVGLSIETGLCFIGILFCCWLLLWLIIYIYICVYIYIYICVCHLPRPFPRLVEEFSAEEGAFGFAALALQHAQCAGDAHQRSQEPRDRSSSDVGVDVDSQVLVLSTLVGRGP